METLAARVERDGPLNERDAVGWIIRLAKRVERLHQLGVAHGGISTYVVLTDGPSCRARGVLGDVRQASIRPAFHSPERHNGAGISPDDDAWALAVTLYALLTGHLPFSGETTQEIRQRIEAAAPAPLAVYDVGDDDLQNVLDQFITKDPSTRTSRAARLRALLEAWHPDPFAKDLPPLDEVDDAADVDEIADEEENVATVMRDFTDVRKQIEAMEADAVATGKPTAGPLRAAARALRSPSSRPPAALAGPPARRAPGPAGHPHPGPAGHPHPGPAGDPHLGGPPAIPDIGDSRPVGRVERSNPGSEPPPDRPTPPTVIERPIVTENRPQAPPPAVPRGLPPPKNVPPPPPAARPEPPLQAAPLAPTGDQAPKSSGRTGPAFDIAADDSDENVATALLEETDLSSAIAAALAKGSQPGGAAPAGAGPPPGWPPAPRGAAIAPTAAAARARAPLTAADVSLEQLLRNQPESDAGMKRALIVGIVLLVLVVVAVVYLFLGQEGKL